MCPNKAESTVIINFEQFLFEQNNFGHFESTAN